MDSASNAIPPASRQALRQQLLIEREHFAASVEAPAAHVALARHLMALLHELEPELLGLYWPVRSEFNAVAALQAERAFDALPLALPFARRTPVDMHYRCWTREPPTAHDDCGIATSSGAPARPDVVLVPCVGFTADGYRLGYGGGYFDRWLALNPGVTAIGVAWAVGRIGATVFEPQAHDRTLALIVTEHGVA